MHPSLVVDHRPGADTDHDVMSLVMGSFEKMDVVRSHEGDLELSGNFQQRTVTKMLCLNPVIMEFEVEVLSTKNVHEFAGRFFGFVQVSGLDRHVDFTFQTGAHTDQARTVFGE